MIAVILRWLPLSLALHSAALAATLLLPRDPALLPLFVDLTLAEPVAPPDRSAASESAAAPGRQQAAAAPGRAASPPASTARVSPPSSRVPDMGLPPPAPPAALAPAPEPSATPAPPAIEPAPVESNSEVPVASAPSPAPVGITAPGGTATAEPPGTGATSSGAAVPGGGGGTTVGPSAIGGGSATTGAGGAGDTLALGISGDDGGVYAAYIALLRRRVQEALTYPSAARRRGMTGTVHLDISVEPTGRIADVLVVRSSSHDVLDTAALDAVRALRRVPFPSGVRPRAVRVRLPVVFELR